ncbi:MAG: cell division protein FtsZ [Chloroflexi bacterium]|nr:cell division protein FtsZ [Chloroflexota bacterium]
MPDPATLIVELLAAFLVLLLILRLAVGRVSFRLPSRPRPRRIAVIGVGGAGSNAVDAMVRSKVKGVDFIACNTDVQALRRSRAPTKVQIGHRATGGLGSGGDPAVGRQAAEEDGPRIARAVSRTALLFVAAGLGGGTGSGAAPVVAALARERGALTVGVVTMPFAFEGQRRATVAAAAAADLGLTVNTMIALSNDRLHTVAEDGATMLDAFAVADDVLRQVVDSITQLISVPGLVNLDFADLRAVLTDGGPAAFGVGHARGDDRTVQAVRQALASPLLERGVGGARSVLFHIAGPPNLRLAEVREAADEIRGSVDAGANVIFGATIDKHLRDEVRITVIATGLGVAAGDRTDDADGARPAELAGLAESAGSVGPAPAAADDLEVPTYIRSGRRARRAASQRHDEPPPPTEPGPA